MIGMASRSWPDRRLAIGLVECATLERCMFFNSEYILAKELEKFAMKMDDEAPKLKVTFPESGHIT
jgi:hypothetical protein